MKMGPIQFASILIGITSASCQRRREKSTASWFTAIDPYKLMVGFQRLVGCVHTIANGNEP
ncbi:unnamed protein product [Larinioides sclopetarius]|uniref:Uncharacterized protein n=1 Tax=Larinioides sclopetarius TaxID=280406 RepID=A0AAV2A458_9ARAC